MNYITYVLMLNSTMQEGWNFKQNDAGHLVAFHPQHGSRIFHSEEEFKEWIEFNNK
ncbi:hypothetical protein [Bacillus sp. M6-12]|uniref:hypothetical protein n=1 Tax=Bacillus sp. M6-12 TaxID=2054166 RepID=UPI0015E0F323|nr:hypothetical protein [Bacillus sp. M6-12]